MKKTAIIIVFVLSISLFYIGCTEKSNEIEKIKVGISMPSKDSLYWNQEGNSIKYSLTELGYDVDLQYADDEIDIQILQIKSMIEEDCKVIVIAPIETGQLTEVLSAAKEKSISIISYKELIMNTDAVSYLVTFDDSQVGYLQGTYIVNELGLDTCPENQSYTIEIFPGYAGNEILKEYYEDAMKVLQPYIDSGVLTIPSGAVSYEDTVIQEENEDGDEDAPVTVLERMVSIINKYYDQELILDAVYCVDDTVAMEAVTAIDYNYNGDFPVITGYGCTLESVSSIIDEKQSMSVFMDSGMLADKTVEVVDAILKNTEVPVNDSASYNNGVITVPACICETVYVDKNNYEEKLIESGYYTKGQLN